MSLSSFPKEWDPITNQIGRRTLTRFERQIRVDTCRSPRRDDAGGGRNDEHRHRYQAVHDGIPRGDVEQEWSHLARDGVRDGCPDRSVNATAQDARRTTSRTTLVSCAPNALVRPTRACAAAPPYETTL